MCVRSDLMAIDVLLCLFWLKPPWEIQGRLHGREAKTNIGTKN